MKRYRKTNKASYRWVMGLVRWVEMEVTPLQSQTKKLEKYKQEVQKELGLKAMQGKEHREFELRKQGGMEWQK